MPLEIRPARPADLDAIFAIEQAVFAGDRLSRRSFVSLMTGGTAVLVVAEAAGRVAGYGLVLFRRGSRVARLYSIAVAPGVSGVGAQLLRACEAAATQRGAGAIRLEVRADNARAIALYRRGGYAECGRVASYYHDGETALRFEKGLAPAASPPGPPGKPTERPAAAASQRC
jgi:ribosomal protein S18 acetylase RimI-like enzyme